MTTIVNRAELLDALRALRPVAGNNPTLPVLGNVALQSHDDGLTLTATNLEVFGLRRVEFEGEALPGTTVPAKAFADFVGGFSGDEVSLTLDGSRLRLQSQRQKASLSVISIEEFPAFAQQDSAKAFTLTADEFECCLSRLAGFAAKDIARPILTGVQVRGDGSKIRFAAADNYRVGVNTVDHQTTVDIVIPATAISLVPKVCGAGDITITTDTRTVIFSGDKGTLRSRLIEGQYPNIDGVMPTNQPVSILVARDDLAAAAKLALVASDIVTKFEVADDGLRLYSKDHDKDFDTTLDATVGGSAEEPVTFALKTAFVTDVAAVLADATEVEILWGQRLGPVELRDHADPTFRAVIMPVRTP